ncbi:MAG: prohibitin family protein [Armatimonadetes bacterium]|nr:prohibitin family protein [Armatimonadota bacterium]
MRFHSGGSPPGDADSRLRDAVNRIGRGTGRLKIIVVIVLLILALNLLGHSVVSVGAGERAVVFSKVSGVLPTQLGEGWHVLIPWVWEAEKYDVRRQTWTVSIGEQMPQVGPAPPDTQLVALTKDGQQVVLDVSVVYHPDPDYVWRLHQRVGPYYLNKVLRPQTRCICRMVVSQYPVTDVYSGRREEIQNRIARELGESLKAWDIVLDQLLLRNVQFGEQFQQAIEAKQVAIQEYERMQYVLLTARKTADQKVIEAEGEAESLRLQGKALRRNPLALNYEYAQKVGPAVRAVVTNRATTPPVAPGGGR